MRVVLQWGQLWRTLGWEGICDGQGDAMAVAEIVMVWKYFIAIIYFLVR
jgi:hypothetical protein